MRIGLFDSGVGGLTVFKKVVEFCPDNSFIYLADTKRLPYGVKTVDEIIHIAEEISSWFSWQSIDVLLVACNTTNANALSTIKKKLNIPVFDLIKSASLTIQQSRVGVIATPSTVRSKAYTKAILELNQRTFVIEQSCPSLVPLIEMDKIKSEEITDVAKSYLKPLLKQKIESLVLGCSHYPLITPLLSKLLPSNVKIIDPAEALAFQLKSFVDSNMINFVKKEHSVDSKFFVTSNPEKFAGRVKYWLDVFPEVNLVSLQKKGCVS